MKNLLLPLLLSVGSFALAQQAPEFPELKTERFTDTGYIDENGTEHKMLIKKPDELYLTGQSALPKTPFNLKSNEALDLIQPPKSQGFELEEK